MRMRSLTAFESISITIIVMLIVWVSGVPVYGTRWWFMTVCFLISGTHLTRAINAQRDKSKGITSRPCEKCGYGNYVPTGTMLMTNPPRIEYKCNKCGDIKTSL